MQVRRPVRRWLTGGAAAALVAIAGVVPAAPAGAAGNPLTLSPTHGPVGTTITVSGLCPAFFPVTTVGVSITGPGGSASASGRPDHFGAFSIPLQVPASMAPGPATVDAACSPGGALDPATFHVDGPPPTATITTPSGLSLPGEPLVGTASDAGGPGVQAVLVYYFSYIGGPSGVLAAQCPGCGVGHQNVSWTMPHGAIPPGIYAFVAQAIDTDTVFGGASNVVSLILE